jgi:hypothetical protein
MEKKVLVAVAATLMSSVGALHAESSRAADAAPSAYEDSAIDASLDPGEERVSADGDNQARLKDLRYAYFIGYNARAREDSKPYATLGDEVKHPQKQLAAAAMPAPPKPVAAAATLAPPKPVAERVAPPRQAVAQAAPLRQVLAPVAAPKRVAAARTTPSRQIVAQAAPAPLKRVPAQAEPLPARRVSAPLASLKQASLPRRTEVQPAPMKLASAQPVPLKQVATRARPSKPLGAESEPPILIPTQAVTSLPDEKPDNDGDAQVAQSRDSQNAQRAAPQYRQADEEAQYSEGQGTQAAPQARQYQYRQPRQYTAAPAYNQASTESQESGGYSGRQYAPPPRTTQASQYAPAQYPPAQNQTAYAQSAYVPRPPAQATAQQVVIVARPPAYPSYNQMYTPPELRRPYPAGYGNSAQPTGYQGWE